MPAHGSLALPARLDPFQEIVEVGWNTITHIAAVVTCGFTEEDVSSLVTGCSSVGDAPARPYATQYYGTTRFAIFDPTSLRFRKNSVWTADPELTPDFSAMPESEPPVSLGAWGFAAAVSIISDTPLTKDVARSDSPGADSGIPSPGDFGNFEDKTTAAFELLDHAFTEPGQCYANEGEAGSSEKGPLSGSSSTAAAGSFSVSGATATLNGKTFTAVGIAVPADPNEIVNGIMVLFEREGVTA